MSEIKCQILKTHLFDVCLNFNWTLLWESDKNKKKKKNKRVKLSTLAPPLCNWVLDFQTNRPQSVRINNTISATIILNTGSPQGCVLSPLLYTLLTHDCRAHCDSNLTVKFADDTPVAWLITDGDESAYRLVDRDCGAGRTTSLSTTKTKKRDDSGLPEEQHCHSSSSSHQLSTPLEHLHQPMHWQSYLHHARPHPPCAASGREPPEWKTASSRMLSGC